MTKEKISKEKKTTYIKSLFECDDTSIYFDKEGRGISLETFADLMITQEYRRVASDMIGDYHVSTVWLGINHAFSNVEAPTIFETMIFGGEFEDEGYMERYSTEKEALEGHKRAVELVKSEGLK
jgi:hypothetical protein